MPLYHTTETRITDEFPLGIVPGVTTEGKELLEPPLSESDMMRLKHLQTALDETAGANELLAVANRVHNVGEETVKLAQQAPAEHRLAS